MSFKTIQEARVYYMALGYDAIPLHRNTKKAVAADWPNRPATEQWQEDIPTPNIGIRCGGTARLAVIDCDDREKPGTYAKVVDYLGRIGLEEGSYPSIQSASGNMEHIYLELRDAPSGNYRKLAKEMGAGELRYGSGAYVVAPPSRVNGREVQLVKGNFAIRPEVDLQDLLPLLPTWVQAKGPKQANNEFPESEYRVAVEENLGKTGVRIPRRAYRLLHGAENEINRYHSRSEAEHATVTILVNAGFTFEEILRLFITYPVAGRFREMDKSNSAEASTWLRRSYDDAVEWTHNSTNPERVAAQEAAHWAMHQRSWPGAAGMSDRAVYIAHAQIAYAAGHLEYDASCRELGELSGRTFQTAANASRRLVKAQLICVVKKARLQLAHRYRLLWPILNGTYPSQLDDSNLIPLSSVKLYENYSAHDAFRGHSLGQSAAEVYGALRAHPGTVQELADRTGRTPNTICKALRRMKRLIDVRTGEIVELVT